MIDASTQTRIRDSDLMSTSGDHRVPVTDANDSDHILASPLEEALLETRVDQSSPMAKVQDLSKMELATMLQASHLLASVLELDKLLPELTSVTVDLTDAQECGICVADENGEWRVTSTDSHWDALASGKTSLLPGLENPIASRAIRYVLRSQEELYLDNVLGDERFAGLRSSYADTHPQYRALIAQPILFQTNLLGCVYCQAQSGVFTQHTEAVLRVLVDHIGK